MPRISSRNIIINQNQTNVRHCSFCYKTGHTIRTCNDSRINLMDIKIKYKKEMLYIYYPNDLHLQRQTMTFWLLDMRSELIKAYSIRFCGGKSSQNISSHVDNIIKNIYPIEQTYEEPNPEEPISEEPISEDPIPEAPSNQIEENNNDELNEQFIQEMTGYLQERLTDQSLNNINHLIQIILQNRNQISEKISIYYRMKNISYKKSKETSECSICYDNIKDIDMIELNCKHKFCVYCIKEMIFSYENDKNTNKKKPCCALCREKIEIFTLHKIQKNKNCNSKNILENYLSKEIV